ncbi:uncharacterized protein LOC128725823 [Anopheles nili]|uniref:uncharacterized protein LOC128725823 n=1 Tax=Anopheles nili TaxID=185578 RepID=UPI00237C0E73|nr:uncharacterized protein LOC128725823 [Anopheles nili]
MKTLRLVVVIVQRVLITGAVFFAAAVLIHFTAIDPKEHPVTCDRACNRADWPRICRFELVVEKRTFHHDSSTGNVSFNTEWPEQDAVITYYTINGRYVGPTLTVCKHDFLVVDVENRIPGESISLHWTGQSQQRTPYMDGVPMITQCPITSFTRFQYKFQADHVGTHLYHGFTGSERTQGLLGAFVVRSANEPKLSSISSTLRPESVWLITQLNGRLAINGQRSWQQQLSKDLHVRLLYAGGACRHWLELEDHELQVLALDGNTLEPNPDSPSVDRILLHDGLRMDFAVSRRVPADGDKIKPDYEIRFTPTQLSAGCGMRTTFRLRYDSAPFEHDPASADGAESIKYNLISPPAMTATPRTLDLTGNACREIPRVPGAVVLCPQDLHGERERFPKDLATYDTRLVFTIGARTLDGEGPFGEPYHETVHSVNGFTFAFPSVLLLRDPANAEVRAHTCGGHRRLPRSCHPMMARCECVHVEHIEAGHRVEMVLINADLSADYVYHLHGVAAFVVAEATGYRTEVQKLTRNLQRPLQRDTIVVRRDSIVVVRFVANAAGLWMLRDIGSPSWSRGLDVVLNVGTHQADFDIPSDFPSCRHFVGPRYFLI